MDMTRVATPSQRATIGLMTEFLDGHGLEAHLVGGFVRDVSAGQAPADMDVCIVTDDIERTGREFSDFLGSRNGGVYSDPRMVSVTVRTPYGPAVLDLTPMRAAAIEDDLRSRDLTINALAVRLGRSPDDFGPVIDPTGGLRDLRDGTIRLTSPAALDADPLRLLRVARFAHRLDFVIETGTVRAVESRLDTLGSVAGERQRAELIRMLSAPGSARDAVELLEALGLLAALFPEVEATRGVAQPARYHVDDVLGHLVATVGQLELVLDGRAGVEADAPMNEYLDRQVGDGLTRRDLLPLAALLHDVGKPETMSLRTDGEPQFLGHEQSGADMVRDICHRLRFSSDATTFLVEVVRNHMRPFSLAAPGRRVSARAIRKFATRCGDTAQAVLLLHLADLRAARGSRLEAGEYRRHLEMVDRVTAGMRRQDEITALPPLISGLAVLALGVPQGPEVGRIIRAVERARALGEINTREQAVELAKKLR